MRRFTRAVDSFTLMSSAELPQGIVLTGLADEAGDAIETQIKAHLDLGWKSIELRMVSRRMVSVDLGDAEFNHALAQIDHAGFKVEAVASAIGNWSRPIDGDFSLDVQELERVAPRMKRLGAKFLRTMSWMRGTATDQAWRDEAIRRYRVLARLAEQADVVLLHENCAGWGGQSAEHMRELIDAVGSPHVGVLFDIGNTISHGYEPWSYYEGVRDLIRYVHVKDCRRNPAGGRSADYALAGEGHAMVREIVANLLQTGYRGTISIEPHIAAVIHHGAANADPEQRYQAYLGYARRLEEIVSMAGHRPAAASA